MLGRDGSMVGEFATERRQIVTYDQIPPVLRNAIISAEDATSSQHGGFESRASSWRCAKDIADRRKKPARSTLTQQLARKLFLDRRQDMPERKIKEALLRLQIEKRYTKQEIFTMYCNKIAWGIGTYGVEAASQLYFGKTAKDLTLDEAAIIAGIIQGNSARTRT